MSDCLIVGGGIIGMMSARTLANAGMNVVLLDQAACGMEASWAAGGIISPLYPWHCDELTNQLSLQSQAVYEALCEALYQSSGIDPEYQKSGLLMLDEYQNKDAQNWLKRHKVTYTKHKQGALFEQIAQLRNPRLLQALKIDISKKGVIIKEYTKAHTLIIDGDKVLGVKTEKADFLADNVLICAGAWSKQLSDFIDVYPVKGQMIILKSKPNLINSIILKQGRYLIPRADGRILVGSTLENVGFDKSTDISTQQSLHHFATQLVPSLAYAKIEYHWAGLRPASQSGKFIIKKEQKYRHLFINTGHSRNGLNTAPASADKITELIINNKK